MKLRELLYFVHAPAPKMFAGVEQHRSLGRYGELTIAQWTHPRAQSLQITEKMIDEMRQFVREGDLAVDVGAHCGDSTLAIACAAGVSGEVVALEPNRFIFPILAQNAALTRTHANIAAYPLAALDCSREVEFEYGDPDFMNGGERVAASRFRPKFRQRVQGVNLASLLAEKHGERLARLTFVKTDVEGHDLEVLKSIRSLLERYRPVVKSEVFSHLSAQARRALYEFFVDLGYRVHRYGGDESMLGEAIDLQGMDCSHGFDLLCIPK